MTLMTSSPCVLGVDGDGGVSEHGLGTGGGDGYAPLPVREGIAVVPKVGLLLAVLHFGVAERRAAVRAPVDYAVAAVDESFLVVADKGVEDGCRAVLVHGERLFGPVAGSAEALQLLDYPAAVLLLPRPSALEETFPADIGFGQPLFLFHLLDDLDLGGYGGVICAGEPQRLKTAHALETHDYILHGLVEGVPHVQLPGDVGRRHHDGERLLVGVDMSLEISALHPEVVDPLFKLRIVCLVHRVHIEIPRFLIIPLPRFAFRRRRPPRPPPPRRNRRLCAPLRAPRPLSHCCRCRCTSHCPKSPPASRRR